jgi:hypothetical protein
MKTVSSILICALALSLSACATADRTAVLKNLEGCERHYQGAVSAGPLSAGFTGTVRIDCGKTAPGDLPPNV